MKRRNHFPGGILSGRPRLLENQDDDPLSSVANLFDAAMVFAVALLLALVSYYSLPELLSAQDEITILKNPGSPNMEIIRREGIKLQRYRMTLRALGGEGVKLGTAYRLKTGEVVYVPER
ncbi:MAG TPA: DUF2149 domain-containing protein [Planctomycetes bacterium]|nr:DUF2149 domain-containing protein [Planctomycetota bacterium]